MKRNFIGFYNPTNKEIEEAWKNGVFAFDANSLLNLYRYTDNTRKDFIGALHTLKEKLFLPYQAAYEFFNNRLDVIEGLNKAYEELYELFPENFEQNLKNRLNQFKKHPSIVVERIVKLHNDFLENVKKELNKQKTKHPDFNSKDDILDELSELFDNSVGEEFSRDDLIKIYKEGEIRYANEVPPGYKDLSSKQKQGQRHIYGDLIIWKELINLAKNQKIPLIFITDDRKEDWWTIRKGKTIRPREDLIKEFYDITGIRILIYNADNFLHFAKEKGLLPKIKNETIEEVKNIRISDETYYKSISEIIKDQSIASQRLTEMMHTPTYVPMGISDIIREQTLASQRISSMMHAPTYIPTGYSDIIREQTLASQRISDIMNTPTYIPHGISDMIREQSLVSQRLSDMMHTPTYIPKSISDIIRDQSLTSQNTTDMTSPQNDIISDSQKEKTSDDPEKKEDNK